MATIDLTELSDGELTGLCARLTPNDTQFWSRLLGQNLSIEDADKIRVVDNSYSIWSLVVHERRKRGLHLDSKNSLLNAIKKTEESTVNGMTFKIDKVKGTASYDGAVLAVRDLDKIVENTVMALATTGVFSKPFYVNGSVECSLARDENDSRLWVTVGCKRFRADEALYVAQRLKELLK